VSTERRINSEQNNWIPALIDSAMQLQPQDYSTTLRGNRLLAAYYTDRDSLAHALGLCTNLLTSGLTFNDSILVALDIVGIQMLLDSSESGNLDADALSGVPFPLRARSVQHAINLQRQLLGVYGTGINAASRSVIPSTYRLYQNYPNPFNPNTEIQFDLPEMVKVQIKIFNTLGQEVTTLVDEVRPAGAYRILWDSKSASGVTVASGVYVYQIKAGNFVDSKKMVLIR